MIGFPGSFTPEFQFIRHHIQAGNLGDIKLADTYCVQRWFLATRNTWRQDPKLSGGGQAYDTGAHMFHGLLFLVGAAPTEVTAITDNCGTPVDINSVALLRFANGAIATATVSGADVRGWENAIYISGTAGSVRTEIHGGKLELWNANGEPVKYPRVDPVPTMHRNFLDAIHGKAENLCPALWGLRQAMVMEAFYKSAKTGKPVKIAKE
jgi:predicted dehydrogenase